LTDTLQTDTEKESSGSEIKQAVKSQADPAAVLFRNMSERDIPAVLDVEGLCYSFPWSERVFRDCLSAGYICRLAELEQPGKGNETSGNLVGHGILMMGPAEAHVLNLCVVPIQRGSGLASRLLRSLLKSAATLGAREVFLEVRRSNHAARTLYEKEGFNRIAIRQNYYNAEQGREDAVLYALTLTQ